jgi:hypothetical protein
LNKQYVEIEIGWWKKALTTSVLIAILMALVLWVLKIQVGFLGFLGVIAVTLVGLTVFNYVLATRESRDDWVASVIIAILLVFTLMAGAILLPNLSIEKIKEKAAERLQEGAQQLRDR